MSHVVDVRNSMQKSEQPEPGHVFEALNVTKRFGGVLAVVGDNGYAS